MSLTEKSVTSSTGSAALVGDLKDFLIFRLLNERYGVPLLCVREVFERQTIKTVPYAPSYYLGIMNLRGRIVSVIDLAKKFGMRRDPAIEVKGHIIMLDVESHIIGVLVDQVLGVRKVPVSEILPNPSMDAVIDPLYMLGVTRMDGILTSIVELSKLIDQEELEKIRKIKQREEKEGRG